MAGIRETVKDTSPRLRDDRVLPEVRIAALGVIIILALAVFVLYFFPNTTGQNFAWAIKPNLTALAMGAGYAMGIYFFLRALTVRRWHSVAAGFLPITTFTIFMLLATFIHWDRFNHAVYGFYFWTVVYIITPVLVPFLWWRNRTTDPHTSAPTEVQVPLRILQTARLVGAAITLGALLIFLVPDLAINSFPWKLTPLTARVIAGWAMLPGVGFTVLSMEPRWSGWRVMVEASTVGLLLFALALSRAWGDLAPNALGTWVFLAVIFGALVGGLVFYLFMQTRRIPSLRPAQREGA